MPVKHCSRCHGTGKLSEYGGIQKGICFSCGGTGKQLLRNKKGSKYQVGDRIQHNTTKRIFEIKEVRKGYYKTYKYASDGITLLDTITQLGKHIDNYPEDSKDGYTKL